MDTFKIPDAPGGAVAKQWEVVDASMLRQQVYRFDNSKEASRYYNRNRPRAVAESHFPGKVRVVEWNDFDLHADSEQIICVYPGSGTSRPSRCGTWSVWLQYGQYDVEVSMVSSDDSAIKRQDFELFARAIDRYIANKFR
jgi:pterin-4a-carbinolamine dehydratase